MIKMDPFQIVTGAVYAVYALQSADLINQHMRTRKRAEKYWQKEDIGLEESQDRYHEAGKELPKVSLVIPARNESDVIRRTIYGISEINYPKDRMELSIVTDEKEDMRDLDVYLTQPSKTKLKEKKTTLEITRELGKELYQHKDFKVNALSVPVDFDGYYPGKRTGRLVKSTKGRALNYALRFVPTDTDYLGIYDADAKPDPDVLIGVASKHLKEPSTTIMQGPIFQIGNYNDIGLFSKTISLYQSVAHDWYYPLILEEKKPRMPFIGGTNYFIKPDLLEELKGFDPLALTEDWDLGARAWIEKDAHASFLPYPAIEQTPPTIKTYFKQRLRWREGGLEVKNKIMHGDYDEKKKKEFRKWSLRNELTLAKMEVGAVASPFPAIALAAIGRFPDITGSTWPIFWGFTAMNIPSVIYPSYLHKRYLKYIEDGKKDSRVKKIVLSDLQRLASFLRLPKSVNEKVAKKYEQAVETGESVKLTLSPILGTPSLSSAPWIWGGIKHALGKGDKEWHKTPRTKNVNDESLKDDRADVQTFGEMLIAKGMDEEYALKQLVTYSHDDPKKSRFYSERVRGEHNA